MFEIEYKGGNSIVIATKGLKLISDPNLAVVGLKNPSVKDAVELATEPRFLVDDSEARLTVEGPGEYEIGDFSIRGVAAVRHIDTADSNTFGTTIYRIGVSDVRVALLGNVAAELNEDQLEAIGVVDIVVIPVGGGGYTLNSVQAAELVRQIDPKVVVPIHYADSGLSYEVPQDALKLFIDELGAPLETVEKYKLKSASMLPDGMVTVEIKRT